VPLSLPKRPTLLLLVAVLTGTGCVQQGDPGVTVTPLKADIVFGIKEPTPPAAPANVAFARPEVFGDEEVDDLPEKVLEIPDIVPLPRTPLAATASECPDAALTAFPKETAEVTVKGTPAAGLYRFKRSIEVVDGGGQRTKTTGFEQRAIRRVTPTEGKAYEFSYQVVQPNYLGSGGFTTTTYRVNNNTAVIQNVNEPPRTIGLVTAPGAEFVVTPPQDEPGIFVDRIEVQDDDGNPVGQPFEPIRPIKYLPLDEGILRAGQTWSSLGIDATTGRTLLHQGTVVRKTRVDACGEIVEGWLIEATQTFSDELVERRFFYNVATQKGALFIAETTQFTDPSGLDVSIDLSLAKVDPTPLPKNLQ